MQLPFFQILEYLAAFLGAIGVLLAAKQKISNWWFSLVSVIIYVYLFYTANLLADSALQIIYIILTFYGYYQWKNNRNSNNNQVYFLNKKQVLLVLLSIFIIFIPIYYCLISLGSSMQLLDAFTFSLSLVATYLLAKKYIQNWIIWIVADLIYIYIYWQKQLYITTVLYLLFTIMAIWAYLIWFKKIKKIE